MHEYQYLVGATLSGSLSIYVLTRQQKTLPLKILILFGLAIAVKETFSFLSMTALDQNASAKFFAITVMSSRLGYPLYLLTFLNIPEKRDTKSLMLVIFPALADMVLIIHPDYLSNFLFLSTEFGWTYRTVQVNLLLAIDSILYLGYIAAIIIGLFTLIRKTSFPLLRKKYVAFFASFMVFQVFGILSTNALISLNLLSPLFQLAGIFHFLTFLSIWYAVFLKEKKIPLSVMGKGFPQVYSSFLTIYYNSVVGSRLGEEAFGYTAFIRKSKIEDHVSIDRDKMTLRETEGFDIEELVNKNLAIFSRGHVGDEVIDHYLRVLNAAHQELGPRFDEIVKTNLDFLKNSDLIYGISGGEYLREVVEDESLKDLDDVEACLRIYRRILLPVASTIRGNTRLWEMFSENRIAETMKISDYGEVSINHQLIDRQAQDVIDRFNPILSRIYKEILVYTPTDSDDLLRSLRVVLTLNKDKAVALGIYPTLLGSLATKIPKTQIHRLYSGYLEELIEEKTRELRKTQESLLKSQRLAVIGEAAAMVGHDLRNPLQGIVNLLFLAEKKTTLLSADQNSITMDLRQILKTIGEQVGYMNKIVSDLQDYARPITAKLADTSMPQLLDEILSGIIVPENVRVSIDIEEGLPTLLLDPLLIKRVFTNLITNAIQAMPEGGQLTIEVSRLEEMLVIRFKDTGVGISEDNLDNLFQPLFTTKAKGQGLGLAVCKRLVETINGDISVESESGKGSTFTVRIPYRPNPLDKTVQRQYVPVIKQ